MRQFGSREEIVESRKFDTLVRRAYQGGSRRGVLRVGVGALAATALTAIGLQSDDAEAKKKNKKITICENGETLRVKKKGWQKKHPTATKGACVEPICPAERPVECGFGCCPSEFSKCCDNVNDPVFTTTCNPTSHTCCPASVGGGSCPASNPVCCLRDPENVETRNCCPAGSACCSEDADCGIGGTCNLLLGCCNVIGAGRSRGQGGSERFHMVAR